ncbi:CsbD family protein [Allobranchiibius sp. GilTou38]|uniref:CsbD family protein n=1 Tax=Allobranchiibius sp. GilTou38 TaxID=2815210 RepID=UPI001AA0D0C2|nr:CsbD family protein [Allobranchiibius sp. GilTou38]MBO1768331.1 CsbD family protein [Allobranchiibius sp. GilTou38]
MGWMDKAKHAAESLQGKTKKSAGDATGDRSLQAEGRADQGKASAKKVGDDVKDTFGN